MQTTRFFKLIFTGMAAVLLASCSKTNTQGKLIPKDAAVVIELDGKSLTDKLPWQK